MIESLQALSSIFSIPVMIVIGFTVYIIWSKQEKLYQQQIKILREEVDQPSELRSEIEIIRVSYDEQLKKTQEERDHLVKLLEKREEQNTKILTTIEENQTFSSSGEAFQFLRHEARHHVVSIKMYLTRLHHLLEK